MIDLGKVLILLGVGIALLGAIVLVLGRLGFRGMPGDVFYRSDHVQVYFPIVSCIVISIILTLASWLYHWIARK